MIPCINPTLQCYSPQTRRNRHLGRDCRDPEATDGYLWTHPCVLDSGNPCRNDGL